MVRVFLSVYIVAEFLSQKELQSMQVLAKEEKPLWTNFIGVIQQRLRSSVISFRSLILQVQRI